MPKLPPQTCPRSSDVAHQRDPTHSMFKWSVLTICIQSLSKEFWLTCLETMQRTTRTGAGLNTYAVFFSLEICLSKHCASQIKPTFSFTILPAIHLHLGLSIGWLRRKEKQIPIRIALNGPRPGRTSEKAVFNNCVCDHNLFWAAVTPMKTRTYTATSG